MGIYLNPDNTLYKRALNSKIYVDKSKLIEYTNQVLDTEQEFMCVSRPRRFGKSMAAQMLAAYYSRGCISDKLFDRLEIASHSSYKENLNKYDVIFIEMRQIFIEAGGTENFMQYLQEELLAELRELYNGYIKPEEKNLTKALASVYKKSNSPDKGFIFIIDEWDCIFREKKEDEEIQKKYLDFICSLFKGRPYVKLAYITGILPIKKYGTHSALNMFDEFSMVNSYSLPESFGFTEKEVKELCQLYNNDYIEMQRWYDGYLVNGSLHIYNPQSVVSAINYKRYESYWTNTETYEALKIYIDMNFDGLKDAIITMLAGGTYKVTTRTFQNDMTTFSNKDDVLTLLIHLGYLGYNETKKEVFIPNYEIEEEVTNAIKFSGWHHIIEAIEASEKLLEATINMDSDVVAKGIDMVHSDTTSVFNYNNENSLSCIISVAYYSARKDYFIYREFPSGIGFADIVFIPRVLSGKPAIIVELKWDNSVQGAIKQIKNKKYASSLKMYKGKILLVGINYDKKTKKHQCVIEEIIKETE